jgi:hypothetical protein
MSKRSSSIAAVAALGLATGLTLAVACGGAPDLGAGLPSVPSGLPAAPTAAAPAAPAADAAAAPADAGAAAPKKITAAECQAFATSAQEELDAERIKVDKPCKKADDCIFVKAHACDFTCDNATIPKAEEGEWQREMKEVTAGPCKKWADNDCKTVDPKPAPACQKKAIACEKGKCLLK